MQTEMEPTLATFQVEDAIVEPSIVEALQRFQEQGGSLGDACEALSQSYEGTQDMIGLLIDWTNSFSVGEEAFEKALETVLIDNEQSLIQELNESLPASSESHSVLAAIAASKRWSPVVSRLAERHRGSALHNMLMREARLLEAGVARTNVQTPDGFFKAVLSHFHGMFETDTACSEEDLINLYKRLAAMCTYDECTTIVALRLCSELWRSAEDPLMRGLFRRLGQEIRKEAVSVMVAANVVPEATARQYMTRMAILVDATAAGVKIQKPVVDSLLMLLSSRGKKRNYSSQIHVLNGVYSRLVGNLDIAAVCEEAVDEMDLDSGTVMDAFNVEQSTVLEKAVLVQTLCHAEVFDDIMLTLFSNEHRAVPEGRTKDEPKRRCLALLLAYVAVFICMDASEVSEKLDTELEREKLRQQLKTKYLQIELLATVCEDLYPGCPKFKMKGAPIKTLLEAVSDPLLSRAVLLWAHEGLKGGEDTRALMVTASKHLAFLERLAEYHPIHRAQVLEAIREAFVRDYPGLEITQIEDMRDMFMKSMTCLVKVQMAPQLVKVFLAQWADNERVDKAHLRRFVGGVLETICPPYSRSFTALVLRMLRHKRISSAIERDTKISKLVMEFRKVASDMGVS